MGIADSGHDDMSEALGVGRWEHGMDDRTWATAGLADGNQGIKSSLASG